MSCVGMRHGGKRINVAIAQDGYTDVTYGLSMCPWSHTLPPKKVYDNVSVPPALVQVPSQQPLVLIVTLVTSF
jgi:hypothetical protein